MTPPHHQCDISIPAYILSGGRCRRFGSDKARATLDGAPLIRRIADMLAPHVGRISVVADTPNKYQDLELTTIVDRAPDLGPIGGLDTALHDLRDGEDWLLMASCDLITVQPHWIDALRTHADASAACIAYRGDRWEPLFALYRISIMDLVEQQIQSGRRAMQDLLNAAPIHELALPDDWPTLSQVNTRDDLRAAVERHDP